MARIRNILLLAAALLALLFALPLSAATVALTGVTLAAPFEAALKDRYGSAEGAVLQAQVTQSLARTLKAAGATLDPAAPLHIEVSIEDAVPTHPTRAELERTPSLDYLRSVSRGGAHLVAVLRGADGRVLERVDYERYAPTLKEASLAGGAWGDADRAIDGFVSEVAAAWRRHAAPPRAANG